MGLDKLKKLKKDKAVKTILSLSDKQKGIISRNLSEASEDELWAESGQLKDTFTITFIELGRRLAELQGRYSKKGTGSFQKKYIEKGFKKTEVETLISKYNLYDEQKLNGTNATELLFVAEQLQEASQKTIAIIKKAPEEVKEMFFSGIVSAPSEVKAAVEEVQEAEIIEEVKDNARVEEEGPDYLCMIDRRKELQVLISRKKKDIKNFNREISEIERALENRNNLKIM